MAKTCRIYPSNSVIFIEDASGGIAADAFQYDPIMVTPTCIAVGTYPEMDGETEISLSRADDLNVPGDPVFDGMIETPTGTVIVSVVAGATVLEDHSGTATTRIRVWTNHPSWPNEIIIGFGP